MSRSMGLCKARRKVRWKKTHLVQRGICCSWCGWAKGAGHDWECVYVVRREILWASDDRKVTMSSRRSP